METSLVADSLYDRFSGQARKVVQLACIEAQRRECDYLGTEHLLVALFRENSPGLSGLLATRGMDLPRIREKVTFLLPSRSSPVRWDKLPLTPRVKRVIAFAREEAARLNHPCIGPEHLLLGMLRESDAVAGHILLNLGFVLADVRATLEQLPVPENRDWMMQLPGSEVAADPPPRMLDMIATEAPIPGRVAPDPRRDKPDTAITTEEVAARVQQEKQPESEAEGDSRPWEQRGNFRRDCEPYNGYTAHTLAWCAVVCAAVGLGMMPFACIGLLVSRYAWAQAQRDIDRMHKGVLDPSGMASAQSALRLAHGAGVANAISLLLCVSALLALVVLVSRT